MADQIKILSRLLDSHKEPTDDDGSMKYIVVIVKIMYDSKCSIRQAMHTDFLRHSIDVSSVMSLLEYLEGIPMDLDRANYFMKLYTGSIQDFSLEVE